MTFLDFNYCSPIIPHKHITVKRTVTSIYDADHQAGLKHDQPGVQLEGGGHR